MKAKNDKVVVIREMEFDDLPTVFHLGETLFAAGKWPVLYRIWDEYEIMERFLSDQQFCFVALVDKKIVGFIIGCITEKAHGAWSYGYVHWLGIREKYQSQGLGRKMLNKLTHKFIEEGAKMMMADTASNNEKAIAFFKKRGFDDIDPHVYMTKNLLDEPYYQALKERGEL
jgi:ribosomal protein S18 acetylase RimI-like enzyme